MQKIELVKIELKNIELVKVSVELLGSSDSVEGQALWGDDTAATHGDDAAASWGDDA